MNYKIKRIQSDGKCTIININPNHKHLVESGACSFVDNNGDVQKIIF